MRVLQCFSSKSLPKCSGYWTTKVKREQRITHHVYRSGRLSLTYESPALRPHAGWLAQTGDCPLCVVWSVMAMLRQLGVALGVFDRVRIDHDSSTALSRTLVAVT